MEIGLTDDGKIYGGDGTGSILDWIHRIIYETDQYNPIALLWDGAEGYATGKDRFANELGASDSTIKILSAIPVGRYTTTGQSVLGYIFRDAAGHVNPSTITTQARYFSLFEGVASNPSNIVPTVNTSARLAGVTTYNQTFRNGKTVWVHTINGTIRNAGVKP